MPADQVGAQDQVAEHEVVGDELAHPLGAERAAGLGHEAQPGRPGAQARVEIAEIMQ